MPYSPAPVKFLLFDNGNISFEYCGMPITLSVDDAKKIGDFAEFHRVRKLVAEAMHDNKLNLPVNDESIDENTHRYQEFCKQNPNQDIDAYDHIVQYLYILNRQKTN